MDEGLFFLLLCGAGFGVLLFALIGFLTTLRWLLAQFESSPSRASLERAALHKELRALRTAPDPLQALDEYIERLGPAPAPPIKPAVQPAAQSEVSPAPAPSQPAVQPAPPAPRPAPARPGLQRWLDLDNITLLLYLGAALVVIAVGVFVGSSWDAIGGLARWAIVTFFALAFMGAGEGFVRRSPVLARAGETFKDVGALLLPFSVLAYERFVLAGQGGPLFWVLVAGALALLYYALYRWSNPGRLTAYLAALSLAVLALRLPDSLGLTVGWRMVALLLAAAAFFAALWRAVPDGRDLWQGLQQRVYSPLVESYLIVAILTSFLSFGIFTELGSPADLPGTSYLALVSLLLLALAWWLRARLLLGSALIVAGAAIYSGTTLSLTGEAYHWGLLLGWNLLALPLFALAPHWEVRWPGTRPLLYGAALFWSLAALLNVLAGLAQEQGGPLLVASLPLLFLLLALAARERSEGPLLLALPILHLAILDFLRLLPSESPSALIPTLIWLGLAALWLGGMARQPLPWVIRFWPLAFVAEAIWSALFALSEAQSASLAGVLLVGGWLLWARLLASPWGVAAALLQGLYALYALMLYLALPTDLLPFLLLAAGALLVAGYPTFPPYAQAPSRWGGQLFLFVAPLAGLVGEFLSGGEPRWLSRTASVQASLGLAALAFLLLLWRRPTAWRVAPATFLSYLFVAWLTLDYLPAPLASLAALALALLTMVAARRAPAPTPPWLDTLGLLVAALAPLAAPLAALLGASDWRYMTAGGAGQLSLLLAVILYAVRGWQEQRRMLVASAGILLYLLYAWLAVEREVQALQMYSVPLAALVLALGWLFPRQRPGLEWAGMLLLLVPATFQSLFLPELHYSLLLAAWGLMLLGWGITYARRVPLVGGVVALLLAALSQLWGILFLLPPGVLIGLVGLLLMGGAVLLTLRRDALLRLRARGESYWEQLGREEH